MHHRSTQRFRPTARAPRRGFTIVELLVVVAVIGTLTAILLPALAGARNRGRKVDETSRLRAIGTAWTLYAGDYNDAALPGLMDDGQRDLWRVKYNYPNGDPIDEDETLTWPWRLLPYVEYDQQTLLAHMGLSDYSPIMATNPSDPDLDAGDPDNPTGADLYRNRTIAEFPAFGYNAYYVGGVWDCPSGDPCTTVFANVNEILADGSTGTRSGVVARTAANIRRTSQLILFCTTKRRDQGEWFDVEDTDLGSWLAVPATLGETELWRKAGGSASADTIIEVLDELNTDGTPIPVGRFTGQAVSIAADLHIDTDAPGAYDDQRRWINSADRFDYKHTE
jgi:prepilin-type N-terminal cleavage/methylation domain-containing protein